jgi:hypothetical protein
MERGTVALGVTRPPLYIRWTQNLSRILASVGRSILGKFGGKVRSVAEAVDKCGFLAKYNPLQQTSRVNGVRRYLRACLKRDVQLGLDHGGLSREDVSDID